MQGRVPLPCPGLVVPTDRAHPPFVVLDRADVEIAAVTEYLAELALGDSSPLTCRSYAYDLLRWFRFLWILDVDWTQAAQSEVAVMVGWLRTAPNPQRRRHKAGSPAPGTVNLRTGKPALAAGYARTTINHALSAVSGFYAHHDRFGRGPVINPVPVSPQRRAALAHRSPLEPTPPTRRARSPALRNAFTKPSTRLHLPALRSPSLLVTAAALPHARGLSPARSTAAAPSSPAAPC